MLLFGASGHARVICSCLEAINTTIEGIFDDNETIKTLDQYNIIGKYDFKLFESSPLIISIGNNLIRRKIAANIQHKFGIVKHPSALIDKTVIVDLGTVIMQGAIIQRGTSLGKHVIINTGASVDHDCVISDYAHISPKATLCGNVTVGEGTQVGAGAIIIQGVTIGKWAMIGAGAVVRKSIPDYAVVVGNPSKIIKYNKPNEQ